MCWQSSFSCAGPWWRSHWSPWPLPTRRRGRYFPKAGKWPAVTALVLVAIPERTAAVSRVNNDVLLEALAAAFIWLWTRTMLRGLSRRTGVALGLLLGLGVLAKASMAGLAVLLVLLWWANRRSADIRRHVVLGGAVACGLVAPFVARNLLLYGDVTGLAAFGRIWEHRAPELTLQSLAGAGVDLFASFWLVRWDSILAPMGVLPDLLYLALFAVCMASLYGVYRLAARWRAGGVWGREALVMAGYGAAVAVYAAAVVQSYFSGGFPLIQGRLLLPVVVPAVILLAWGLSRLRTGMGIALAAAAVLMVADALVLFAYLLPYHYYWSAFVREGVAQPWVWTGWREAWALFSGRLLSDKPGGMQYLLVGLPVAYLAALAGCVAALRGSGGADPAAGAA